jgi:cytochrome bd-type quinol oxidase subunit 1
LTGKDLQHSKHTSTIIVVAVGNNVMQLFLSSCNSWITTMDTGVFSMWSMKRSYLEDNCSNPLVESQPVKRRLGDWCEMAASLEVISHLVIS